MPVTRQHSKLANCILDPLLHRELSIASLTIPAGSVEGAMRLKDENKKMEDSRITSFGFFSPSRLGIIPVEERLTPLLQFFCALTQTSSSPASELFASQ
jgi:hypothetical protein